MFKGCVDGWVRGGVSGFVLGGGSMKNCIKMTQPLRDGQKSEYIL